MRERRTQERHTFDDDFYLYSSSISTGLFGKIIDISLTGISFSYIMDFEAPDDMNELGILALEFASALDSLPFKTVSDEILQGLPRDDQAVRRRSGVFTDLTVEQVGELERFIGALSQG